MSPLFPFRGVVESASLKIAGDSLDEAVIKYVRRNTMF
jgi:actin-like ATPase involved in cell morphogenesis